MNNFSIEKIMKFDMKNIYIRMSNVTSTSVVERSQWFGRAHSHTKNECGKVAQVTHIPHVPTGASDPETGLR